MSPVESDDLTEIIDEGNDVAFKVYRSPETAEHEPDYQLVGTFPSKEAARAFLEDPR